MPSNVEIANMALTKLGETHVLGFTDDSKAGRALNAHFDLIRDAELRRHLWNFAMTRASLPALAAAPEFGFERQFQLPAECLRLVQIGETYIGVTSGRSRYYAAPGWQVEGRLILTDEAAPLYVRYIKQVSDPTQFDAVFVDALACRLAFELCETITQSNSRKASLRDEYDYAIMQAKAIDAMENPPEPLPPDDWILARA